MIQFIASGFSFHRFASMETTITTTIDLEAQVGAIVEQYRKEAFAFVEEMMWSAFEEIGECILKCGKTQWADPDSEEAVHNTREYLYLMSRRSVNGLSSKTLHEIVRLKEKGCNFEESGAEGKVTYLMEFLKVRSLSFEATRAKYPNYLKPWTHEDDARLEKLWSERVSMKKLAEVFGRNIGAIEARIDKLGLESKYGNRDELAL